MKVALFRPTLALLDSVLLHYVPDPPQYHPPFTLGFMRKNEVWVQLDEGNPKVKEMVARARAAAAAEGK